LTLLDKPDNIITMKDKFLEDYKNIKVQSLYGCPVMIVRDAFALLPEELEFIKNIEYQKKVANDDTYKAPYVVQVSKSQNVLQDYKKLKNVREKINEYAGKYIDDIISVENEFDMVQSWVSKTVPKTGHHNHHHKGALFSIVYYVQADKSEFRFDTKLNFLTRSFNFDYNIKEYNIFNSLEVDLKPTTGDMLIFPGYIEHSAKNLDTKDKYILGANYFIRGDVGVYDNTTLVKNV